MSTNAHDDTKEAAVSATETIGDAQSHEKEKEVEGKMSNDGNASTGWVPKLVPSLDPTALSVVEAAFQDIKKRTLETLYDGGRRDKSPKGSVDEPIQSLVDLINSHPQYATLSSCSGRIAVFDPDGSGEEETPPESFSSKDDDEGDENDDEATKSSGGKGKGKWLLTCHRTIRVQELCDVLGYPPEAPDQEDELEQDEKKKKMNAPKPEQEEGQVKRIRKSPVWFKHEPLLLHVAASTVLAAQRLLSLGLALGLRESGLMLTEKRVTVALRTQSLALHLPLWRYQSVAAPLVSGSYLKALVTEANQRFHANQVKLQRLEDAVRVGLFDKSGVTPRAPCVPEGGPRPFVPRHHRQVPRHYDVTVHAFPALNLWNHAAVLLPDGGIDHDSANATPTEEGNVSVLVFGGYGTGPERERAQRSNRVWCLARRRNQWASQWSPCDILPSDSGTAICHGLELQSATFTAREGLAACLLPPSVVGPNLVAVFGGRAAPSHPFNELFLYQHFAGESENQEEGADICRGKFWACVYVVGTPPAARWGHTMTAVDSATPRENGSVPVALVVGGRNETCALASIHTLSYVPARLDQQPSLQWDEVIFPGDAPLVPRFHHCTVGVPVVSTTADEEGTVSNAFFVLGGLQDVMDLRESSAPASDKVSLLQLSPPQWKEVDSPLQSLDSFGAASCAVQVVGPLAPRSVPAGSLILMTGGVPKLPNDSSQDEEPSPPLCGFLYISYAEEGRQLVDCKFRVDVAETTPQEDEEEERDNQQASSLGGPMVHHTALAMDKSNAEKEILLLGGGVSCFAFGPSFARCHRIVLRPWGFHPGVEQNECLERRAATTVPTSAQWNASGDARPATNVLFVLQRFAKDLKVALERVGGLLDTTHRMVQGSPTATVSTVFLEGEFDPKDYIAVPVTLACLEQVHAAAATKRRFGTTAEGPVTVEKDGVQWWSLVAATGRQEVPLSSRMFGRGARRKKKP